ncbi:hypothetical protein [Streptomyces sp. NPDC095613]|uniref:hypothetical protein n=1 Tax=Streptomyces sp. NPDC095613 TaxID=3155540 RepID=UPI0033178041
MSGDLPTLEGIRARLVGLADGTVDRESAGGWAWVWVAERDTEVTDRRLWRHLDTLSGADSMVDPDTYLYDRTDFEGWLRKLPPPAWFPAGPDSYRLLLDLAPAGSPERTVVTAAGAPDADGVAAVLDLLAERLVSVGYDGDWAEPNATGRRIEALIDVFGGLGEG